MELLPMSVEKMLPKLYSQEQIADPIVWAKFFDPSGSWSWFPIEGERQEGDFVFFGLVDGFEKELGYFSLNELQSVRDRLGLGIERDLWFKPSPLSKVR